MLGGSACGDRHCQRECLEPGPKASLHTGYKGTPVPTCHREFPRGSSAHHLAPRRESQRNRPPRYNSLAQPQGRRRPCLPATGNSHAAVQHTTLSPKGSNASQPTALLQVAGIQINTNRSVTRLLPETRWSRETPWTLTEFKIKARFLCNHGHDTKSSLKPGLST